MQATGILCVAGSANARVVDDEAVVPGQQAAGALVREQHLAPGPQDDDPGRQQVDRGFGGATLMARGGRMGPAQQGGPHGGHQRWLRTGR